MAVARLSRELRNIVDKNVQMWYKTIRYKSLMGDYCRCVVKTNEPRNLFSAFTVVYEPTTVVYEPATTSDDIAVARMSREPWNILQW